ncbi:unnamed protein product, partial [marine sediment metagenome]
VVDSILSVYSSLGRQLNINDLIENPRKVVEKCG